MSSCEKCVYAISNRENPQIPQKHIYCKLANQMIQEPQSCPLSIKIDSLCVICGNPILPNTGVIPENHLLLLCNNCGNYLYSCPTCQHHSQCGLKNYKGSKPLYIIQEATDPSGRIVKKFSMLNPEVKEEVCGKCICGGMENCQEIGRCKNYKFILEGK